MNFDYSYRSFLITCLLFGILFLAFKSINISEFEVVKEKSFDVEYSSEDLESEKEDLASSPKITSKVETNRAYNEAEKFISEIEKENAASQEKSNSIQESDQVSDLSNVEGSEIKNKRKASNQKELLPIDSETSRVLSERKSAKKNSTVSYSLIHRSALNLPNPVYTCPTSGKIVINIVVSESGKILDVNYNKSSSNSSNECLIDAALEYAKRAEFTTLAGKNEQLGSITYIFQGQR